MLRIVMALTLFASLVVSGEAAVQSKKITYKIGDQEYIGYLAWDDATAGKRPGVLVVHEWWGLNDYARGRADQLAKLGYVAFACDMYGDGKSTEHPSEAGQMAAHVRQNIAEWQKRANAALNVLKEQPQCDATHLAAIGYCFGGSTALELAYSGADLDAVATFHAALPTPTAEQAKAIKAKLLICNGANDSFIPAAAIKKFRHELDEAGVKYEFINYPGAVHSFTVPAADKRKLPGMAYNKDADEGSWSKMQELFKDKLGS